MKIKRVKPSEYDELRAERLIDAVYDDIDKAVHLAEGKIASLLAQEREWCARLVESELSSNPWLAVKIATDIRKGREPKKAKGDTIPGHGSKT